MLTYKKEFIEFCIQNGAIRFGEFTLKSGRISPYFFNAGLFNTGKTIAELGRFYARAITDAKIDFDIIFGPAYKGIPLAITAAIALAGEYNIDKRVCFNRKTVKGHGEGGNLVGARLTGKVLIIDDVITAGTAIGESMEIITVNNAELSGVCVALDRQEKGKGELSAIAEIEQKYNIKVSSIITLNNLIAYIKEIPELTKYIDKISAYREEYGMI